MDRQILECAKTIIHYRIYMYNTSGVPRNFFRWGGGSTNSVEDRENGDLGVVAL